MPGTYTPEVLSFFWTLAKKTPKGKPYWCPDNVCRSLEGYLEYLEECAKIWENPPHNDSQQAERVRMYATRIKTGKDD